MGPWTNALNWDAYQSRTGCAHGGAVGGGAADMLERLQTLTARVDALTEQVEQLAQVLQRLKTPGTG